jgi:hypothetical protein
MRVIALPSLALSSGSASEAFAAATRLSDARPLRHPVDTIRGFAVLGTDKPGFYDGNA